MLSQHTLAERVDLAERDGLEPARALKAQVEPADAGEEGKDAVRLAARRIEARSVKTRSGLIRRTRA
jgi:hypothetical protein